jgi:hypothetical protein
MSEANKAFGAEENQNGNSMTGIESMKSDQEFVLNNYGQLQDFPVTFLSADQEDGCYKLPCEEMCGTFRTV